MEKLTLVSCSRCEVSFQTELCKIRLNFYPDSGVTLHFFGGIESFDENDDQFQDKNDGTRNKKSLEKWLDLKFNEIDNLPRKQSRTITVGWTTLIGLWWVVGKVTNFNWFITTK